MDPTLQRQRLKRASLAQGMKALQGVVAKQGLLGGLKDVAKVARAGRGFLDEVNYSMHVGTEGRDEAAVSSWEPAASWCQRRDGAGVTSCCDAGDGSCEAACGASSSTCACGAS